MDQSDLVGSAIAVKRRKQIVNESKGNSDLSKIDAIDQSCAGLDFCILNNGKSHSMNELKMMILKHGGNVVQNPGPKTFLCIADNDRSLRVKGIIEKEQFNIATVNWLLQYSAPINH